LFFELFYMWPRLKKTETKLFCFSFISDVTTSLDTVVSSTWTYEINTYISNKLHARGRGWQDRHGEGIRGIRDRLQQNSSASTGSPVNSRTQPAAADNKFWRLLSSKEINHAYVTTTNIFTPLWHIKILTVIVCRVCLWSLLQPPRSTQPGHPSVGRRNEYRPKGGDALRLGVKADMVLFADNIVWSISERERGVWVDALYKSTFTLLTFFSHLLCTGPSIQISLLWSGLVV